MRGRDWIPALDQVEGRLALFLAMTKSNPCPSAFICGSNLSSPAASESVALEIAALRWQ